MAEVHTFPLRCDRDGARRLVDVLTATVEDGRDPGPRGAQIRGLGFSLETLLQALRIELTRVGLAEKLAEQMGTLERVAALARSYRAEDSA